MTQVNYESGKRYPGEEYFQAIDLFGVDTYYLHSGQRLNEFSNEAYAARSLLVDVAENLGLERNSFSNAIEEISSITDMAIEKEDPSIVHNMSAGYVASILARSPFLLSTEPLAGVLSAVRAEIERGGLMISPEKEARIIVMVYRASRASGKIDGQTVADMVQLGAG